MIKYILALGLFLQLIANNGNYQAKFIPPAHTVSYIVKDPTVTNKSGTCVLTDSFLGVADLPKLKLKQVYVYNEHTDDLFNNKPHYEDTPMLIVKNKDKFWDRLYSVAWTPVKKMDIVYIPEIESIDSSEEINWMPETLWVGEEWKGKLIFGSNDWTHEWHKVIDYKKGIWYVHSISIYVKDPQNGSCYDEQYKNSILINQIMTDCHAHVVGGIKIK